MYAFGDDRPRGYWVVLVPIKTHIPSFITVAHTQNSGYLIFLLLANQNRYANEVLNMRIWWKQTTWVVLVSITTHIPSFINVVHTELWIFDFFVISQSEQICKWGIRYIHSVTTDHVSGIWAPTTHILSLMKIGHCVLIWERRFTFWCWRETHTSVRTHTSVHPHRQRYKWKPSGPST